MWQWLFTINVTLTGRNRILLNGFLSEQEMISGNKNLDKLEAPILEKIWDLCGGRKANPTTTDHQIQKVDVLLNIKEASAIGFTEDNLSE